MKYRIRRCMSRIALAAVFLILWTVGASLTNPLFIPSPMSVLDALVGLAETGQLQKGLAYSFLRITCASALSMAAAIPMAVLIYGVPSVREMVMPVIALLRFVPVTAFSPLLILWCGIGERMKVSFLFVATFVYLLPSVLLCFNVVFAAIITIMAFSFLFDKAGDAMIRRTFKWRYCDDRTG